MLFWHALPSSSAVHSASSAWTWCRSSVGQRHSRHPRWLNEGAPCQEGLCPCGNHLGRDSWNKHSQETNYYQAGGDAAIPIEALSRDKDSLHSLHGRRISTSCNRCLQTRDGPLPDRVSPLWQTSGRQQSCPFPPHFPQVAFPKIRLECVNLVSMVERHREEVDEMKALFGYHYPEGTVIEVL